MTAFPLPSACFLLLSCAYLPGASATGDEGITSRNTGDYAGLKAEPWKESLPSKLPPYPADRDLVALRSDLAESGYRYYIDRRTLSRGKDLVVRYVIVLRSSTGSSNVFYEGMRCGLKGQVKTYAFGDGRGSFRPNRAAAWRPLVGNGAYAYRPLLHDYYFCRQGEVPRSVKEIRRQIALMRVHGGEWTSGDASYFEGTKD